MPEFFDCLCLPQKDVADLLDMSAVTFNYIMRGVRSPGSQPQTALILLETALHLSAKELAAVQQHSNAVEILVPGLTAALKEEGDDPVQDRILQLNRHLINAAYRLDAMRTAWTGFERFTALLAHVRAHEERYPLLPLANMQQIHRKALRRNRDNQPSQQRLLMARVAGWEAEKAALMG